jgi:1-acyl-sn-glycerol-3-phosphate acyltransferase
MITNWLIGILRGLTTLLGLTLLSAAIPMVRWGFGNERAHKFTLGGLRVLCRALTLHPLVKGEFSSQPALYLCNHPSYLDILFAVGQAPSVLVAADEFRSAPFIGWLGRALQTVWVRRKCPVSRSQVRETVVRKVREGTSVFVFPEGQTTGAHSVQEVKPGLFRTAVDESLPIAFLSIRYSNPAPLYFHTMGPGFFMDWLRHAWHVLCQPQLGVVLKVSAPTYYTCPEQAQEAFYAFHQRHLRQAA